MYKRSNFIFNKSILMNKLFTVECKDDSFKPEGIFDSHWIKKGDEYTIKEALTTGEMLAFAFNEITPTPPYNSYLASRFDTCKEIQPLKGMKILMGIGFTRHEGKTIPAGFINENGLLAIEYDTASLYRLVTTISRITLYYGSIASIADYINSNAPNIMAIVNEQLNTNEKK